jgi:hypothetical protein
VGWSSWGSWATPPSEYQEAAVEQVITIIGQTVLVLAGLAVVVALVVFIFAGLRAIKRLIRDLRQPSLPYTDSYVPESFDRPDW